MLLLIGTFAALLVELQTVSANIEQHDRYSYWLLLHRKAQKEILYQGIAGDMYASIPLRVFLVKTGIAGERPTPLPQLLGRQFWLITAKEKSDNPETAPYFLTLNVPGIDKEPFGPVPYTECNGQCYWTLPGAFGLHGVNGDNSRLSAENRGSSGCIRHKDDDITYLYQMLDPHTEQIRYYILDI